jgi:hypothetical protein
MQVQLKLPYKTQKAMKKLWGKKRAFEIASFRQMWRIFKKVHNLQKQDSNLRPMD